MNEGVKLFAVFAVTLMAIGGMAFITADDSDAALGTYTGGSNQSSSSNPYTGINVEVSEFSNNFGSGSTIYLATGSSVSFTAPRGSSYPIIDSRPSWMSQQSGSDTVWSGTAPSSAGNHTLEIQKTAYTRYNVTIAVVQNTIAPTGISISGDTSGDIGDKITLTATVSPSNATNKNVSWSIDSGSSYASISSSGTSCTVSLTKEGSVTIRATAQGNSSVYDTHTIQINDPVELVTSVSINGATNVQVGDEENYSVTVRPTTATDKSIEWSLSSTSRAEIVSSNNSSCTLDFKSAGTVILYAYAQDGSGESDSIQITIEDPEVPVTSVTISGSTTVEVGASITLSVSVSPSNATNKNITWTASNGNVSLSSKTNTSCKVTGVTAGSVTITATNSDSGRSDTHTITVQKPNQQFILNFSYTPGTGGPSNQNWTLPQDTYSTTVSASVPQRTDGYVFDCWKGSDGENYDPGDPITLNPGTTTLTAQWKQSSFTCYLYYSAEGASNVPATDHHTGTGTTDHEFTIENTIPTKSGYVFLYWSCDSTRYDPGDKIDVPYNSSKTLTAVWDVAQLDITSTQNDIGMTVDQPFSYTVISSHEGCTVSVSGADWLSVNGNVISGTPTKTGPYNVTVTIHKDGGYIDDTQSFTITVYSKAGFVSQPGADGFYTYMND